MGILGFFKPKAEISIKFDYEIDNSQSRELIKIPSISERLLNQQPANPSLTSEATGRLYFKPDLLGFFDEKQKVPIENETNESIPVYKDGDSIKGSVFVKVPNSLGHYGIKIEFFGTLNFPGGLKPAINFCHLSSSLAAEGQLTGGIVTEFPFEFRRVEMTHESYNGRHLQVKYLVKVSIKRGLGDISGSRNIWVKDYSPVPLTLDQGWALEVGLEDQLHINFTSPKSRFSLSDNIEADLSLVRREIVANQITDQEVLHQYQIIDGPPDRYDTIPFRFPLKNLKDLTPSLKEVEKIGSLLYFVNLIIYDVEGRRYFKQQEIQLYRDEKQEKQSKNLHLLQ